MVVGVFVGAPQSYTIVDLLNTPATPEMVRTSGHRFKDFELSPLSGLRFS